MSWLPGTHSAVPASTMLHHEPQHAGVSGPRSTRSPTKTALRPSGWRRAASVARRRRSRARASSASSSSKQPWTSPMMSNGPCRRWRSIHSGCALDRRRVDLLGRRSTYTCRNPSRCRPFSDRAAAARCWRTTCGPKSRSGRVAVALLADRLGQVEHDRDRQARDTPRELDERLARLALHVGRVDDGEPAARQPLGGDEVQRPRTRPSVARLVVLVVGHEAAAEVGRDDSVGREVRAREASTCRSPTRRSSTTSASSGSVDPSSREHRHLRRRRRPRDRPAPIGANATV